MHTSERAPVLALGVGLWMLIDILRVWLPSLITVFGQAAGTPPELMGGFALVWFLAPFPVLIGIGAFFRSTSSREEWLDRFFLRTPWLLAVPLLLCRLGLEFTDGGGAQLYLASAGVLAGMGWLAAMAMLAYPILVRGFATGVFLATATHAALGTYGAVWRSDVWSWILLAVQVAVFLKAMRETWHWAPEQLWDGTIGADSAFLLMPGLLLAGVVTASPARAEAAVGWPDGLGAAAIAVAALAAVILVPHARLLSGRPVAPAAALVLSVAAAAYASTSGQVGGLLPWWAVAAQALAMVVLPLCLEWTVRAVPDEYYEYDFRYRLRTGIGALLGGVVFVVVLFVYYAGYDLGYRAEFLLVAVAALIAGVAVLRGRTWRPAPVALLRLTGVVPALAVLLVTCCPLLGLAVWAAPAVTVPGYPPAEQDQGLRVMSYNIRMGYGMDGTFDFEGVAATIRRQNPDVVTLSEVDRAWFLNGGQDELGLLARSLGMTAVFAPAADQVWGDAVLTRLPVLEKKRYPLADYGAPTGAQALAVVVEHEGTEVEVISTHLQPPPGEGPVRQAADLAKIITTRDGADRPTVLAGDFNFEPGSAAWQEVTATGLVDALAEQRPLPTSPAGGPQEQIDHIFASPGLRTETAAALDVAYSDHLPVVVTLHP